MLLSGVSHHSAGVDTKAQGCSWDVNVWDHDVELLRPR